MSDFITAMGSLFTFLIAQLGAIATFFVTSILGQIIVGISLFALVFTLLVHIIIKLRG